MQNDMAHFYRHIRDTSPIKREVRVDVPQSYPSDEPMNDSLNGKNYFHLIYEREQRHERSISIFDRLGVGVPRNRPKQKLSTFMPHEEIYRNRFQNESHPRNK